MNNVLADDYGFTEIIFLVIAVNRGLVPLPPAPTSRNQILTMGAQLLLFKLLRLFPRIQSNDEKTNVFSTGDGNVRYISYANQLDSSTYALNLAFSVRRENE